MKARFLPMAASLLVAGGLGWCITSQERSIAEQELERTALHARLAERNLLLRQNAQIESLRNQATDIERHRQDARELHKLRNEVRQLRDQQSTLTNVRAQHERLRKLREARGQPTQLATPIPFIAPAEFADRGQATPEAAVLSFFWAMKEGQIDRAAALVIEPEQVLGKRGGANREQAREAMKRDFEREMRGFRIVSQRATSALETHVELQIATANEGIQFWPMNLRLIERAWKIDFNAMGK
jgi:hypothetical protein